MTYPKLVIRTALAMVAGLGIATSSWGGSATSNLSVTASVANNCTIGTTPVAFGAYDPLNGTALLAEGTIQVKCTLNASSVKIGLGLGSHPNVAIRQMLGDGTNAMSLPYELYQPSPNTDNAACAQSTVWTVIGGAGEFAASGLATNGTTWGVTGGTLGSGTRQFRVCGRIATGQNVEAAANYTDTVVATVGF